MVRVGILVLFLIVKAFNFLLVSMGFPGGSVGKEPACNAGDTRHAGSIPGPGIPDPLEEGMETHSSILGWRIPWTEEPGRL